MKKTRILLSLAVTLITMISCSSDDKKTNPAEEDNFIRAADLSFVPEIEASGTSFYNNNQVEDILTTLKNSGCNTIRLRLWKQPGSSHSGLAEVKQMAQRARQKGMKVWIAVHYSDSWADPGKQEVPAEWQAMNFEALKSVVATYTKLVVQETNPDIIQIGNETNDGMLWPMGRLTQNPQQYLGLLNTAIEAVRSTSGDAKIMVHFAGIEGSDWFFDKVKSADYDYIGLSYYPVWHGKNLTTVKNTINRLGQTYGKKVLIAETAYPFTLQWADWTNNIVGESSQLIPGFAASDAGQKLFVQTVKTLVFESQYGAGFAYWGGEWIAFKGAEATNGSSFENQALYDFDHKALPVMQAFSKPE